MKKNRIFIAFASLCAAFSLQSCLDYDVTGSEFNADTKNIDKITARSEVDKIPYDTATSAVSVRNGIRETQDYLNIALGTQFSMRGGKKGEMPGEHAYQYQFSLGADIYSQYGVVPHTKFIYADFVTSSAYNVNIKAYGGARGSFNEIVTQVVPLLNHPSINKIPELKAIYLLLFNYSSVELADIYGPFPYQDLKTNRQDYPYIYNSLEEIYKIAEANIDTIVKCLKHFDTKPADYKKVVENVLLDQFQMTREAFNFKYENLDTWVRFANSLKLRMAMHISKADPQTAQRWAEEAVASGVIETEAQEVALRPSMYGKDNPLLGVYNWGDMCMTASMESLLKSLNHPYVKEDEARGLTGEHLFMKNHRELFNSSNVKEVTLPAKTRVVGMRSGAHPGEGQGYESNQYIAFSKLNTNTFRKAPLYLMKLSEVCFLRAEGAVRGWQMGGTAQSFYEQGVRSAGFEDREMKTMTFNGQNLYDALVDEYLQQEHAVPYTYVDPTGDTAPVNSVTAIGVKWNENDSKEVKLEKIITQKYIAGFPYSFEAWTDLRRTGYPKLFEVLNADEADGSIRQGDIIRRLYFPDRQDESVKKDIEATGLPALNGPDVLGTRLWWDLDVPNF